jgi:hypothetical protein
MLPVYRMKQDFCSSKIAYAPSIVGVLERKLRKIAYAPSFVGVMELKLRQNNI